jgi:hypothetical protein
LTVSNLGVDAITDSELIPTLNAIIQHKDRNMGSKSTVPLYHFWNQAANKDGKFLASVPNIDIPLGKADTLLQLFQKGLAVFGLHELSDKMKDMVQTFEEGLNVFKIPADSDDTGVNLALKYKIYQMKDKFPRSYKFWMKHNDDPKGLIFDIYKKYAYEPFSPVEAKNTIDPRTYYWIHLFLHEAQQNTANIKPHIPLLNGKPNLKLITTWMQDISELGTPDQAGKMPFNVNNVDLSVLTNALYGITSQVFEYFDKNKKIPDWFDRDLSIMYASCVRLLEWSLRTGIVVSRPDVTLPYYPSPYQS